MKITTKILLIGLLLLGLSLSSAYRAYAMSEVILQNNTNFCLNLVIDGNMAATPAQPNSFCRAIVTPGGRQLEARKCTDGTVVKSEWMDIADGSSPVWPVNSKADELDIPRVQQAIMSFYRTRGEWAGVFVMDSILQIKPEKLSDRAYTLNVEYHYTPIPNNRLKRTDSGVDRRIFTLEIFGGNYTITSMGGYNSARF